MTRAHELLVQHLADLAIAAGADVERTPLVVEELLADLRVGANGALGLDPAVAISEGLAEMAEALDHFRRADTIPPDAPTLPENISPEEMATWPGCEDDPLAAHLLADGGGA